MDFLLKSNVVKGIRFKAMARIVMRSNPELTFFYFLIQKYFTIYYEFSTSFGRSTDLKFLFGLLLVSFIWLGEKISLKCLLPGGLDVSPPHA